MVDEELWPLSTYDKNLNMMIKLVYSTQNLWKHILIAEKGLKNF